MRIENLNETVELLKTKWPEKYKMATIFVLFFVVVIPSKIFFYTWTFCGLCVEWVFQEKPLLFCKKTISRKGPDVILYVKRLFEGKTLI